MLNRKKLSKEADKFFESNPFTATVIYLGGIIMFIGVIVTLLGFPIFGIERENIINIPIYYVLAIIGIYLIEEVFAKRILGFS